ncbi:MAG: helix-turn-helix transcriptional regulator [Clostridia bacterium]|nr:helix-turn-helix transcriptional regulator [Clostridia bacterium]
MVPQFSIVDVIRFHRTDFSFKTENKACWVLTCRVEGESLFSYNKTEQRVKRGDVLFIPYGASYSQSCKEETLVCFHLNVWGKLPSEIVLFEPKERERICELFLKAARVWKHKKENYELLCTSVLYEILSLIPLCSEETAGQGDVLKPALTFLETHLFDGDLSLKSVCSQGHVSRTHFNKLFFERFHLTPTAYVNQRRIRRAEQLLVSGTCSNEEIAALCGFRDVKYFYVVFKKITGVTTKEYKKEFEKQRKGSFASHGENETEKIKDA